MNEFPEKIESSIDIPTNWVSLFMAFIFALPSLGIFLGIYYGTGNLIIGIILGFGIHFVILAFSGRISKYLNKKMN